MTEFELIKAQDIDGMTKFILHLTASGIKKCFYCVYHNAYCTGGKCEDGIKEYLKTEV